MIEASAGSFAKAKEVLRAFLDASVRHDDKAMHACLTRRSLEDGQVSAPDAINGMVFVMDEPQAEGELIVIHLRALPPDAPEGTPPAMAMNCLMTQEDGQWKFDLAGSAERMMAGLDAAMGQVASAMAGVMGDVGQALSDGLRQAFGDGSPDAPRQS